MKAIKGGEAHLHFTARPSPGLPSREVSPPAAVLTRGGGGAPHFSALSGLAIESILLQTSSSLNPFISSLLLRHILSELLDSARQRRQAPGAIMRAIERRRSEARAEELVL